MRKSEKIKIMKTFRNVIDNTSKQLIILIILIICIILVVFTINKGNDITTIISTILVGILQALIVTVIVGLIYYLRFNRRLEDSDKAMQNYEELCKIYSRDELIEYEVKILNDIIGKIARKHTQYKLKEENDHKKLRKNNKKDSKEKSDNKSYNIKFPIIHLCRIDNNIIINDSDKEYEPPEFVMNHFDLLYKAHAHSNTYNNPNIRLDDFKIVGNKVELYTSRTQYIYGLVTNKVMDYNLENNITLRKMYAANNSIGKLKDSKMSNHIGFNAIVITSDDNIVFIKRFKNLSVEKGNLGLGVQGSLKYKAVMEKDNLLDGFYNAIYAEIEKELKVEKKNVKKCDIIGLYRNIVEGGKPQFLVKYELDITAEKLYKNFEDTKAGKKNKKQERDGDELVFLEKEKILNNDIVILPDGIAGEFFEYKKKNEKKHIKKYENKWFEMVPSSTASIIMWLKY